MWSRHYTVSCDVYTAELWLAPGNIDLDDRLLVSLLLQRHAVQCTSCDLTAIWQEHGIPELQATVGQFCALEGRRN